MVEEDLRAKYDGAFLHVEEIIGVCILAKS